MTEAPEILGDYRQVDPNLCDERDDNPNRQSKAMFAKLLASISACQFVDPIVVRQKKGGRYEVLGGAHRLRAAKVLKMKRIPIMDLGVVSSVAARQLLVNLNETKGTADADALAQVIQSIKAEGGDEALQALPYNDAQLADFLDDDESAPDIVGDADAEPPMPAESTVKIKPVDIANMFDFVGMSQEQYLALAQTIQKWRNRKGDDMPAWQHLLILLKTDR